MRGFLAWIAGRDELSAAQDRRRLAERFHLVQFVADVKDGAAFVGQLPQGLEQFVGFLGRQNTRWFIENKNPWF